MKEIKAYIRPEMIERVVDALEEAGIAGMTLIHVQAIGECCDPEKLKLSMEYAHRYSRVVKLEIICAEEEVARMVDLIRERAHTGEKGDGMIFVSPVEGAVSIRTNRQGRQALRNEAL